MSRITIPITTPGSSHFVTISIGDPFRIQLHPYVEWEEQKSTLVFAGTEDVLDRC